MNIKTMPLIAVLISATAFSGGSAAFGEEVAIDNIIITANRREQPISEVGNSVSVLSALDLEKGQFPFVLDALASVPGVAVSQNGGIGGTASVSIRGAGGDKTLVFVDGVRMNDASTPGSSYDFGTLDPYNIERIEILRGPQSVLYGSDAIGGVVNVITKSGGEGQGASGFLETGSFATLRGGGSVFGGTRELGFNIAVSGTHTDGISAAAEKDGNTEADGFDGYTVSGKVTARPTGLMRGDLIARYSDSTTEFDPFGFTGPVDGDEEQNLQELMLVGRGSATTLDGKLTNTISLEYSSSERESLSGGVPGFRSESERKTLDYLAVYDFAEDWTLTAGAQHEIAEAVTVDQQSITTDSVLGELSYTGVEGLVVTGGARYVDHETFGDATTARVTASYAVQETGTRFLANWSEGFKSPSIFQMTYICTFCGLSEPTAGLQPETSEGYEFGVEQALADGRVHLGATLFHTESDHAIIFTFFGGYQNLGRSGAEGFELSFDAEVLEGLDFKAHFTQTDATDLGTGTRLLRQPEQTARAELDWSVTPEVLVSLAVTYNGDELDFGGSGVDEWTRVDVRTAWDVTDGIQIYGRIDNLLDEDYTHVVGYGTPGLSGYLGVRANW